MKQILLLSAFIILIFLSLELALHLSSNVLMATNKVANTNFIQTQKQKEVLLIKFFKDVNKFVEKKSINLIKKCHI